MNLVEAEAIYAIIPVAERAVLRLAHARYLRFIGIVGSSGQEAEQVKTDRNLFPQYYNSEHGFPAVLDESLAGYMSAICGLPWEWCIAIDRIDFAEAYGADRAKDVFSPAT